MCLLMVGDNPVCPRKGSCTVALGEPLIGNLTQVLLCINLF